ncbi:MAG: exosortase F system-associated protein [Flavobacterium sp.]|nr:exosortase F system-associated protein [Flavobacterium sp.]
MWPKNNKALAIFLAVLLVILLAAVRAFEQQLFYDPFIAFFKSNYQTQAYPEFATWQLFVSYAFRFSLNTLLSLLLLYVLFADKSVIKVATLFYVFFFLVLIGIFFALFYFVEHPATFVVFYVRRFLIQPLFIILFIPAFYYQKRQ